MVEMGDATPVWQEVMSELHLHEAGGVQSGGETVQKNPGGGGGR